MQHTRPGGVNAHTAEANYHVLALVRLCWPWRVFETTRAKFRNMVPRVFGPVQGLHRLEVVLGVMFALFDPRSRGGGEAEAKLVARAPPVELIQGRCVFTSKFGQSSSRWRQQYQTRCQHRVSLSLILLSLASTAIVSCN